MVVEHLRFFHGLAECRTKPGKWNDAHLAPVADVGPDRLTDSAIYGPRGREIIGDNCGGQSYLVTARV